MPDVGVSIASDELAETAEPRRRYFFCGELTEGVGASVSLSS